MRFYRSNFKEMTNSAMIRLKIAPCCVFCNRTSQLNMDICSDCQSWLTPRVLKLNNSTNNYLCVLCGAEEVHKGDGPSASQYCCPSCQKINAVFCRIVAPYRYEFPIDHVIARMKYGQRRLYGRVLGGLLASSAQSLDLLPDLLVPVPLHASRQAERGYNQAADIARWCATELNLQCKPSLVSRVIDTGSLAGLSKAARQLRILGAFEASPDVEGRRIAIVDDVLTTGATARELARELYDTGALSVELWVLARTSNDR